MARMAETEPCFFLLLLVSLASAHPAMLDCGGLSSAVEHSTLIMGAIPKKVTKDMAKFVVQPSSNGFSNGWTNYSLRITHSGSATLVQAADNHTALTSYGAGICGNDPKRPGHGLCDKCKGQLYAAVFDCTDDDCTFGVSGDGRSKATILVATGEGSAVSYTPVVLDV